MSSNVIVPVPDVFHPALVTVITMLPPSPAMANILICPSVPAASVAVSEAAVVKYDVVLVKSAAPEAAKSSDEPKKMGDCQSFLGLEYSVIWNVVPPSDVVNS